MNEKVDNSSKLYNPGTKIFVNPDIKVASSNQIKKTIYSSLSVRPIRSMFRKKIYKKIAPPLIKHKQIED